MIFSLQRVITTSGQLSIRWIESAVNDYLNDLLKTDNEDYVVASDTDSIYVVFDKLVDKVFKEEQDPPELSHSWIQLPERKLNLLLIRVTRICISM